MWKKPRKNKETGEYDKPHTRIWLAVGRTEGRQSNCISSRRRNKRRLQEVMEKCL
jgi:hypothetical protein